MLLKSKVTGFKRLVKIEILVQFIAVDSHPNSSHIAATPNVVPNFNVVGKPRAGFNQSLVDVIHPV